MIILDTNVVSELMRPTPAPAVTAWANALDRSTIHSTSVSAFEIDFGIARLSASAKKKQLLITWSDVKALFLADRFLAVDVSSAKLSAEMRAKAITEGYNVNDICDILIAGIALRERACVATRNVRDFTILGVATINPWDAAPHDA